MMSVGVCERELEVVGAGHREAAVVFPLIIGIRVDFDAVVALQSRGARSRPRHRLDGRLAEHEIKVSELKPDAGVRAVRHVGSADPYDGVAG